MRVEWRTVYRTALVAIIPHFCVTHGMRIDPCACIQVVGKQEETKQTVNVRTRDKQRRGEHSVDDVLKILQDERAKRYTTSHQVDEPADSIVISAWGAVEILIIVLCNASH